jgi:tetratricopeptide (TPR) repeat protein
MILALGVLILTGCTAYQKNKQELARAHYNLGDAELRKERGIDNELNRRRAYPEFVKAVELDPGNPLYRIGLGNIHLYNRKLEEARKQYEEAIRLDPDNAMARQNLGQVYMANKEYNKALAQFDMALSNYSYPTPEIAYWSKGRAYFLMGNCREAMASFKAALEIAPAMEGAWYQLGVCQEREGLLEAARKSLSRALELLPESAPSHYYLGLVYFRQEKHREAVEEFQKVVELAPGSEFGKNAARYLSILQ